MALKHLLFISLILAVFMSQTPLIQAQVVPFIVDIVQVTLRNLRCTLTGLPPVGANATTSVPFSGALVALQIGQTPISIGLTDANGSLTLTVTPAQLLTTLPILVNSLLTNGTIKVITPLASCNATLPSNGTLGSALTLVETTTSGILRITRFIPTLLGLII